MIHLIFYAKMARDSKASLVTYFVALASVALG